MEDLREHVGICARRDLLEEASCLERAPVLKTGGRDRGLGTFAHMWKVEDDAAQLRLLREQRGQHHAGATADVDDGLDARPVSRKQGLAPGGGAPGHRAVEDRGLVGVLPEPVEHRRAVDPLEGGFPCPQARVGIRPRAVVQPREHLGVATDRPDGAFAQELGQLGLMHDTVHVLEHADARQRAKDTSEGVRIRPGRRGELLRRPGLLAHEIGDPETRDHAKGLRDHEASDEAHHPRAGAAAHR